MGRSALSRLGRARWLAGVTVVFALLQVAPADAHVIYGNQVVGETGNMCVIGYSEISHGSGNNNGFAQQAVNTYTASPSWVPCYYRAPNFVFQHAMSMLVYFWNGEYGRWDPCFGTPWTIQNDKAASWVAWNVNLQCGSSWYYTYAYDYARATSNDGWVGDGVYSGGYHFLPA